MKNLILAIVLFVGIPTFTYAQTDSLQTLEQVQPVSATDAAMADLLTLVTEVGEDIYGKVPGVAGEIPMVAEEYIALCRIKSGMVLAACLLLFISCCIAAKKIWDLDVNHNAFADSPPPAVCSIVIMTIAIALFVFIIPSNNIKPFVAPKICLIEYVASLVQ